MNLIANTGIQFFTVPFEVNLNDNFKMYFHEWFDVEDEQLKLEIAHNFTDDAIWVSKKNIYNLRWNICVISVLILKMISFPEEIRP